MLSIKYHWLEFKYRLIYIIISFILTYCIILYKIDYIILLFSPKFDTFLVYSNILETFFIKIYIAFYVTCLLNIPYLIITIWLYMRPALFKYEDIKFYTIYIILPIIIYYIIITLYYYFLINSINELDLTRFLPSLIEVNKLIKNVTIITILFILLLTFIKIKEFKSWYKLYIKYRFIIIFITSILLSLLLPPDLIMLLLILIILTISFETLLIVKLYKTRLINSVIK